MNRRKEYTEFALNQAKSIGATEIRLSCTKNGHHKVEFLYNGISQTYFMSGTPSCSRTKHHIKTHFRRLGAQAANDDTRLKAPGR